MKNFKSFGQLVFIFLTLVMMSGVVHAVIPTAEREALIAIYNSTGGDSWTNNTGWKTEGSFSVAGTECSWWGVTCDVDELYVMQLNLVINNLAGSIPTEVGNLGGLQKLDLGNNKLTSLPVELGNLTNLRFLHLYHNQLTFLPPELGSLINLEDFQFFGNQLKGEIPTSFINLSSLVRGLFNPFWNGLHTSDSSLLSFLNSKVLNGNIIASQTLDADGVVSTGVTNTTADLEWNQVSYSQTGGYRLYISSEPNTGFIFNNEITDKTITNDTVTGLTECNVYYAKVHSYTMPHTYNNNEIESDGETGDSAEFMTTGAAGCVPVITSGQGEYTIAEDSSVGTSITTMTSLDSDNDDLTYSIDLGNGEGKFAINSTTGEITVAATLDYETTNQYMLTVLVSDGSSYVTGLVTVNITDVDEGVNTGDTGGNAGNNGGGGGGGCSLRTGSEFDPLMPILMLFALMYWVQRRRQYH